MKRTNQSGANPPDAPIGGRLRADEPAPGTVDTDFRWTVRVYYEDTDAGGIVYYANYLRFFERARTEWLRSLELSSREMAEQHACQFVVRDAQIAYRAPARLDDQLMLVLRPLRIRSASIQFRQWALDADSGDLLAQADIGIACVRCDTGRPVALPQRLLNRVAR